MAVSGRLACSSLLLLLTACATGGGERPRGYDGGTRPGDSGSIRFDGGQVTLLDGGGGGGCTAPLVDCGGSCVDTSASAAHCGGCGMACAPGQVCGDGMCSTVCPGGQMLCGSGCYDLTTSPLHCGMCDFACGATETCVGGSCVLTCPAGQMNCSGTCRDTRVDTSHCGACGNACPMGQSCIDGLCTLVCPMGLTACSGSCVDTSTSPMHCGACGMACSAAMTCMAGTCRSTTATEVVTFPALSDTHYAPVGAGMYFWNAGDYVEGPRTTMLSTLSRVDMNLGISYNGLTCDTQDVSLRVNGTPIGSFVVAPGATSVIASFPVTGITGPTYTFRLHTTRTVAGGCGAAGYADGGSTLTLTGTR